MGTVAVPRARAVPKFGRLLRQLRMTRLGEQARSLESVKRQLALQGFPNVSTTTIYRYEGGRQPDIGILWALAQIYRADFNDLALRLAYESAGRQVSIELPVPIRLTDEQQDIIDVFDGLTDPDDRAAFKQTVALFRLKVSATRVADPAASGGATDAAHQADGSHEQPRTHRTGTR